MTIAEQFRGLPMGDLVGAPLIAACEAQVSLARATADFINKVGFEDDGEGNLKTRTSAFHFSRPVQDAEGNWHDEKVEMSVPLLSIVKVPTLSVENVDITFDMEVKSATHDKSSLDIGATVDASWSGFGAKVSVQGSIASHKENTRTSDNSAKYHVNLQARDGGMPEGLARVMDILQSAVVEKPVAVPSGSGKGPLDP
ncbi:DUF2589 domain-containing protein [Luteibacter aegosomaticola]|uniref:DUF2589 domain-containing protein n=1 Tax=Luteibacter aegosomaticola TaxID=2911538 RepID=UPI001FF7F2FE|nr:DUF2589 domain-containing protein [Luteibacter aegosomaticola]UPG90728.1 DUF2589 domain-containing protein [Luteibacter aegosomaticola]